MIPPIALRPLLLLASTSSALLTFCDVKRALNDTPLAVPALLPGLVSAMRCSGLRVPLLPTLHSPSAYPAAYNATLQWAAQHQLAVYASPMEGAWRTVGQSEAGYAGWVAAYAAAFRPSHLSVFNEVGADCDGGCMERVVVAVRRALPAPLPRLVGPDAEHVSASTALVQSRAHHLNVFDVLSSHNAGGDGSNTPRGWAQLAALADGRDLWSSENPACFLLAECTRYGSMAVALHANVSGLVAWNTLGDDVALNGSVTEKGRDIEAGW